jgi:hypothetical protein
VPYGHDSFLLEDALQAPYVRRFLEETYAAADSASSKT